ncbi:MAG: flagellar motor switch protein FliG [Rhodocyclaceae bacterium]
MSAANAEGLEKSATLLLSLGEDDAAAVLRHLGPREVQKLGEAMAALKSVPRERVEEVLDEFSSATGEGAPLSADEQTVRTLLVKALGEDRAGHLLSHIAQAGDVAGIESLKWMDAATVADLVKDEHPQIVAAILAHLEPDHSGAIIKLFPERLRSDVLLRIATLDAVQPEALHELNEALTRLISGPQSAHKTALGGVRSAADILNFVGAAQQTAIVDAVREYDPELAQRLLDEMFVFENLIDVDDRGIQLLLREVQSESLILALKGASEALREKIFKNMSQRAGDMLKEDLEAKGPVRLSEVEREQKEILKVARKLADEGQLMLGAGGDDGFV